ncbi:MAG: 30S ribosomal protein S16 [Armatimonadota bacterium]
MVKIRLRRMGAKKRAFYRLVVCDSRTARNGRFIELVGTYDPNLDPPAINMNKERIEYWLGTGAQPSDTARWLLKTQGFLGGLTVKATPKVTKKAKAEAVAAEAAPEAPAEEPVVETAEVAVEETVEA